MNDQQTLAVLADIHGNAPALEAVLADMDRRGVTRAVNLGDVFYGPLDPARTWALLRDRPMDAVLGNQDRILVQGWADWQNVPTFRSVVGALPEEALAWLAGLPATRIITLAGREVMLCHGTPGDDAAYLLEDVGSGRAGDRAERDVLADLGSFRAGLVLCGHSHTPGSRVVGGVTIFNPGSVGLPAYDDDAPPHVMQAGTPHARYGLARPEGDGWAVETVAVDYDQEAAARLAEAGGRADWAGWLRTGRAD